MASHLVTRLTQRLGIRHPVISAPMGGASGGALAAAVTRAGGLGLIGGGYGDAEWVEAEFRAAGNEKVGCGFITWALAKKPELLAATLARRPAAIMLSFGDPRPFAPAIRETGAVLLCQCQSIGHIREALSAQADVIVAQGAEAGGHGASRGTVSLVAEAADLLRRESPETLLVAAGGIADGRGLAAALMLGADGVLMGTRFWASREALAPQRHVEALLGADGDSTIRTRVPDVARRYDWPEPFDIRVQANAYIQRWHGREEELASRLDVETEAYFAAARAGDPDRSAVIFGEAAGLIADVPPAGEIVDRVVAEAAALLRAGGSYVAG